MRPTPGKNMVKVTVIKKTVIRKFKDGTQRKEEVVIKDPKEVRGRLSLSLFWFCDLCLGPIWEVSGGDIFGENVVVMQE